MSWQGAWTPIPREYSTPRSRSGSPSLLRSSLRRAAVGGEPRLVAVSVTGPDGPDGRQFREEDVGLRRTHGEMVELGLRLEADRLPSLECLRPDAASSRTA